MRCDGSCCTEEARAARRTAQPKLR
jgi:hypothetical protein